MAKSGIYCIENKIDGKKYIGQSVDINSRLRSHKSSLNNNKHPNILLQRAWNKYGSNAFIFYVIEECNISKLNDLEKFYIQKYNTYGQGYNLSIGGDPGVNSRGKKIKQYDLDGNYIKTWENAAEVSRFFNVDRSQVTYAVKHHKTMHGYQWCYENETIDSFYLKVTQNPIAKYDLHGNLVCIYKSLADVLQSNSSYKKDNIWHSIKGYWRQTAYGYKWVKITREEYYEYCRQINQNS